MEITITKTKSPKNPPADSDLSFGNLFTDHMFLMDYDPKVGWHNARIEPYSAFHIDPSTMVLHYGQSIFEGLKAYQSDESDILLFRPQENFRRLNRSARRLCIPEIDEGFALSALRQLIEIEKAWVPKAPGTSLYIRPAVIATDPYLGVKASETYRFFIILSPVGAYYKNGFKPLKIWVSKDRVRAVRGGIGEAKTAGNYAASLFESTFAAEQGCDQVLWLDGIEHKYVQEVGSMNIFFVIDGELVTPALDGSILPGITRDSLLKHAKSNGMNAVERAISIEEVVEKAKSGQLQEAFGTGTAAIISPVGQLQYKDKEVVIGDGDVGFLTTKLYDELLKMQYGRVEDAHNWVVPAVSTALL
ncbi:MAG: branched-chain amino acid aminotransferase [Desulfobacterales bacterium]|nr:branched-chain amino acid aminotransferase [Desulfobacterales bacterium]